jgi:hypothetical protein
LGVRHDIRALAREEVYVGRCALKPGVDNRHKNGLPDHADQNKREKNSAAPVGVVETWTTGIERVVKPWNQPNNMWAVFHNLPSPLT